MSLGYPSCNICKMWGVESPHLHKEVEIEGILKKDDINCDKYSIEAENKILEEGDIIYKYFEKESLMYKIKSNQNIGSVIRCMCRNCIFKSLNPEYLVHYGDGIYGSYHKNLRDADISPIIKQTHGINVDSLKYRVKIRIIMKEKFKKISKTGGVVKSIPNGYLIKDRIVFAEKGTFQILGFERWNEVEWEDIVI